MKIENQEIENSDRRTFRRVEYNNPVQFEMKDPGKYGGCVSADLSEGGIRLNFPEFLPLNSEIALSLKFAKVLVADCIARVVWISKHRHNERYDVGLEFTSLEPLMNAKRAIHKLVNSDQN